jgi:hypothetical protein
VNRILTEAIHSPEAETRAQIKQQVVSERQKQKDRGLGRYGPLAGTPQIGVGALDMLNKAMAPVETLSNLFKSEDQQVQEEVDRRREAQLRSQTPEMVAQRQEFGEMSVPQRAISAPAARAGAGLVKAIAGVTSGLGIAPNQLSEYLNRRGQILEQASSAPLDAQGQEVVRGIPEKVVSALGDVGFGVAEIVALKRAMPGMSLAQILAAETALKTSDMPLAQRADAVAKSALMGKVLEQHLSRPVSAAVFGVPAAIESGSAVAKGNMSPTDALINTGVQAGTGFLMGGGRKIATGNESVPSRGDRDSQAEGQRFYHRDWGEVVKADDQVGARPGRVKVYEVENPDRFHYPRSADLAGRGNNLMVPVRTATEAQPDPMAEALADVKIHRAEEPYAGPQEFRGMGEDDLYDLAARRPLKGTSRQKRLELIRSQAAAIAEIDRRQNEGQPADISPPESGIHADAGDVPSFRDYVENRPGGGLKFETLEPGSRDFNQLAGEYVAKHGSRSRQKSTRLKTVLSDTGMATRDAAQMETKPGELHPFTERKFDSTQAHPPEAEAKPQKPAATANPRAELAPELSPIEPRAVGRESEVVTDRGSEINTRYAVVDLDHLVTSHDSGLRPNPKFPPELQPRERDRTASAEQISRIASNLRPDFLGESPKASEGAPIVGPDGIVESGNGRVLALRQAYGSNNKGAVAYRRFILDNAEKFGLKSGSIKGLESPVLVRIRTSDVDRSQFVKEANEQSIASMSAVEQARSDATSLKGPLLDLFQPSEAGEIATSGNMNFVRTFMKDVVGPNEVNRYVTATGQISQEGIARIRNAIFARAYGDSPEGLTALSKLAESPDSNVRNIVTAMLRNAPGFASLKEGIARGARYPLDAAPDVAAAVSKLSSLRESGTPVSDYLKQGALYGEDLTPLQKRLLQVFDENKRGANTISTILENYAKGAEAAGNPRQAGMFGDEVPTKADLLEAAIQEAIYGQGIQTGLFTTPKHQRVPSESTPDKNLAEANPRELSGPRLPETTAAAAEAQGPSLNRFDSAVDRLKAQEEAARERLAQRRSEYQKLLDRKGSELGASTIPQDLYDYVVIGASKLAQRSLNAAQFVDELVKEFGESIRKHARAIFTLSQRMVADTQKEVRAERLSREIANRLFTENLPKDLQREALRIASQFRTSTDTQGKFLSAFKSRVGEMARSYGAAGGELANRVHLGDISRGHEMEAGNKYLSKIQDVYGEIKNDFERQRISDAVINALEDRASAGRYLDTPEKKTVYENATEMLDMFRAKLKALGYETRDDYFTHIRDVGILDQIISDAKDPKDTSLNELVAANSRFLKPRIDAKMEIKKDLPRVLYAYLKSVTKEVAYSDAVKYYYDQFLDDIPIGLRRNSMDRAIKLMQNSLKPEQGRGVFFRTVGRLRSQQYRNFLGYNLKASAMNFTQVDFARLRWTKEASKVTRELWRKRQTITGPLADAISIASTKETPLMRFLEQFKGDDPSGSKGRLGETFNKYDPFQRSEGRNWALTELGSIINSVVKRPEYQELKRAKGSVEAINELLKKQDVFDSAVREAAVTAAETQVAGNPAMRAEFYDAPLHRIIGMFTAFKTRQMQVLGEALGKQTGIDGARAQAILRRGLSGDAQPVEVLREVEAQRRAMEVMLSRAIKFKEDIGVPHAALREMLKHLRTQEDQLNGIIKRLEPLSGGRPRAVLLTAKYFAKVAAISVFFNLFWDSVYGGLYGDDEKDAEERVSTAVKRAFWDVLPTPFYGADPSKFLVSPVAPNFERSAPFGHITRRGLARDVVSYGATVIPFAGVVDRATNRKLSNAAVDLVAPKKEKERKIKF